jgi:hypothetical protein
MVPARTPGGKFEDGSPPTNAMKADLLLVSRAGRPVIGEVKVATARTYDTDPFLALIQALTLGAQLVSPSQQIRLATHYPGLFSAAHVDIAVIAFKPPTAANATFQGQLYVEARRVADTLRGQPGVSERLGLVAFVEARLEQGSLKLTEAEA